MILFKQIRWRNFLSTGNTFTEVNFTESQTNLIVGTNGAGKSTILDALTFVLFNKPFRKINKPQLINSVNEKDCVVEIEFSTGSVDWKVVRGIKPNIFEIYKDDQLLDRAAAATDQQKWLEENVLKLNYKSFTQIVILGSASFVPFMQLPAASRREIIEDLLDIRIFSFMSNILRERIRKTNESVRELTIRKDLVEEKIEMQNNFIEELDNRGKQNIKDKKEKIWQNLQQENDLLGVNDLKNNELESVQKKIESFSNSDKKIKKLGTLRGKLQQKVSTITKEHKFFKENTVCPTCDQKIEESFRLNRINDAQSKAKELQQGFLELEDAIRLEEEKVNQFKVLSREATNLTHDISKNNTRISGIQNRTRELEQEIQTITEQLENRNTERHVLEKLNGELENLQNEQSEQKQNNIYNDFAHSLMKDGGVKSKIIKRYLPLMNQQINKYLQLMDFYINFSLDEEFKETIKSPIHEDFSYESFSEGEKMRIDLSLLFTWREIAKMKNSANTNLLILDEIFDSSLDGFGTEYFTKIIKFVVTDANVFVISHKADELVDKFDNIVKFDKIKGFSKKIS
jgi:DNA repair exonuclease SbcCD ATPase subunit|tara:strand:- start:2870 stop:4585 length:1716 start_codon:yes stop_codon:yes gene_type:complete